MQIEADKPGICGTCGARGAQLKCSCKAVFYCNAECQLAHWEKHQKACTYDLEEMLGKLQERVGGDDPAVGRACFDLGILYKTQHRFGKAEESLFEALRIAELVEGVCECG